MSYDIKTAIICDGCGARHEATPECRACHAPDTVWEVKRWAEKAGWMTLNRGRFYTQGHFCAACADSGAAIPKAKRVGRERADKTPP